MNAIRLEALEMFARHVERHVPALAGKVRRGRAAESLELPFPSLAIVPVRWRFFPEQSHFVTRTAAADVIAMGYHEATVQLRVADATQAGRATLEQAILDLFADEERPGVLLVDVATHGHGGFRAAWDLDDDQWEDELGFEDVHQSMVVVTGTIPALARVPQAPTIRELILALAADYRGDGAVDEAEVVIVEPP